MEVRKWVSVGSVLLLSLWFASGAHGLPLERSVVRAQSSAFVLPIVKRDSLLNGLQLITLEQRNSGSVAVHLRINSGALFDLSGKGGLADLTAGMLAMGAGGLNAKNITDTLEQAGLTIRITAGWDSTDIIASGPADSLDTIFDVLGRLLISPAFDQKELDALKAARIADLKKESEDDSYAARRKALEAVFGSHPFGRPMRGTPESVGQISRADLVYFHNRFYIANNSALIVSGDAADEEVTRLARSKLGAWKKGEKVPPTFKPPDTHSARRVFIVDRKEEQGTRAAVAHIGLSRRAADYFAALVMADVLGQQASKITAVNAGTTVETEVDARLLPGPLMISIKSTPADLMGNLDVVLETMTRMQSSPPTNDSVEASKSRLIASMSERLKTTEGAASVILDIETYGLGRDYVIHFADRVNAIGPADVQRAAQTYLKPQSVAIVIVGPASRFENPMKKIGTVAVLK